MKNRSAEPRTLAQLKMDECATIDSFTNEEMSLTLMEMGCIPGEKVSIYRVAPLGDPIAISVSGYILSLRIAEASTILVSKHELKM